MNTDHCTRISSITQQISLFYYIQFFGLIALTMLEPSTSLTPYYAVPLLLHHYTTHSVACEHKNPHYLLDTHYIAVRKLPHYPLSARCITVRRLHRHSLFTCCVSVRRLLMGRLFTLAMGRWLLSRFSIIHGSTGIFCPFLI
jgi:hypothetical protein